MFLKRIGEATLPKALLYRLRAHRARTRGDNPELELLPDLYQGGRFIDVGANIGDYSRVASLIWKWVEVFEPNPVLATQLDRELPRNAQIRRVALSDVAGRGTLYLPLVNGQPNTGLASLNQDANKMPVAAAYPVDLMALDDYGWSDVDVIKIDVEGHEGKVLTGAHETIDRCRPYLIVEIEDRHHPGRTREVFQLLWDKGYTAHYLSAGELIRVRSDTPDQDLNHPPTGHVVNFIFTPAIMRV